MAKRRTIGSNPLDSLPQGQAQGNDTPQGQADAGSQQAPVAGNEAEATTDVAAHPALPVVMTGPVAEQAEPGLSSSGKPWKTWWDQALHNEIWIIAGDLPLGRARLTGRGLGKEWLIRLPDGTSLALPGDVATLTKQANHADRKISAMLLWGAAGAFVAGPFGAMAGGLFGGRERKKAVFELELKDGRRVRAETHPATLKAIEAELA
ncbi:hypothetical protein [Ferrovibrio sp.]|uniref:hypothetical protein n=1 Tax=Ferrovibrio sp. TaxID=1917215 RepID=UPI001B5E3CF0|nr:hypothetical protein [Ferrovibrio sp.]MBP7063496.1 hypothetical protein [Ferrovibrio sp.]